MVHISRVGSVFMTLSVTLERFTAIVYPLKRTAEVSHGPTSAGRAGGGQSRGSSKGAKILILVSTLIAIGYNIPRYGFIFLGINHFT